MSLAREHAEWRALVEVSGPFLSVEILCRAFPQGLDKLDEEGALRARLRVAYEEWQEDGAKTATERANAIWKKLLSDFEPPPMDPAILEELDAFVARRVAEGGVPTDY